MAKSVNQKMIARIIGKAKDFTSRFSNQTFVKYLANKGIAIGGGYGIPAFLN